MTVDKHASSGKKEGDRQGSDPRPGAENAVDLRHPHRAYQPDPAALFHGGSDRDRPLHEQHRHSGGFHGRRGIRSDDAHRLGLRHGGTDLYRPADGCAGEGKSTSGHRHPGHADDVHLPVVHGAYGVRQRPHPALAQLPDGSLQRGVAVYDHYCGGLPVYLWL